MDHINFDSWPDDALSRLYFLRLWGIVPFSASTFWRRVREGKFPPPVKVSSAVTAWRVKDVRTWLQNPAQYKAEVITTLGNRGRS